MEPETCYIYTDASFSKSRSLAILGSAVFLGRAAHESESISSAKLQLVRTQETNNIRAEIQGAIRALRNCPHGARAILYTDCQTTVILPSRRAKLEALDYRSKAKKCRLANAELYQEFYSLFDLVQPELIWVKGHHTGPSRTRIQKNFSFLDKAVRENLRTELSENPR